jgi:putative redox protein
MARTCTVTSSSERLQHEVHINGRHRLATDEPESLGGGNAGPGPLDLLVAALAACIATTIRMFARRQGWRLEPFTVDAALDPDAPPQRCTIAVTLPQGLTEGQ